MSDNPTNSVMLPTLEVVRNNTPVKYVSASKQRGAAVGEVYYAPQLSDNTKLSDKELLDIAVAHVGADKALVMIMSKWSLQAQRWYDQSCINEAGQPKPHDQAEFIKSAEGFSARGMSISDLNEEISKLSDALNEYLFSDEFLSITDPDPEVAKAMRKAAVSPRIIRINELKSAVQARKDKKEDDKAAE